MHWLGRQARSLPGRLLVGLVQVYRLAISPVLAPSCRYWPSCSEYAIEALRRHGAARGSWLTARRLCRCHPWSAGGIDEVPAPRTGGHGEGGTGAVGTSVGNSLFNLPFTSSANSAGFANAGDPKNPKNSQNSTPRWRAAFGEPYRDHSDTASS